MEVTRKHLVFALLAGACDVRGLLGKDVSQLKPDQIAWAEANLPISSEEHRALCAAALSDHPGAVVEFIEPKALSVTWFHGYGYGYGDGSGSGYGYGYGYGYGDGSGSGYGYGSGSGYGYGAASPLWEKIEKLLVHPVSQ